MSLRQKIRTVYLIHVQKNKPLKILEILVLTVIVSLFGSAYGETPFFANGGLTQNGIEWCEENYQLYKFMGQDFFEHHNHSIESRVCGNLYNDPLWTYAEPDRYKVLVEKSKYYTNLEIEESKTEAETGIIDTKPVTEQEIPQVISQQQKELKENKTKLQIKQNVTANESDLIENSSNKDKEQLQNTKGGGCLIATATFGTELAPQVQQLRELRDSTILKTNSGAAFMESFNSFYYSFSPTVADYERESPLFRELVKLGITPMLASLSVLNVSDIDSELEMIGYGIGIILINVGMYFGVPAIIFGMRKYN